MNPISTYNLSPYLLKKKIILVTGAGDGIGKHAAKTYASLGATVLLMGQTISKLEIVYDEIHQRLFKIKEMQLLNNFLDSLYTSADIYISPEVGK